MDAQEKNLLKQLQEMLANGVIVPHAGICAGGVGKPASRP